MSGMARRDFLKACLAGAGTFLLEHCFSLYSYAREVLGGRQVSRYTGKLLKGVPSTCEICKARCGIIGFLEGNQLATIGGNPRHPNSRGRICSRGLAGVNIEHDAERLFFPMVRGGERGSGNWEKISWEDALDELANRMRSIRHSGRTEEFLFHPGGEDVLLARRFLDAFGKPTLVDNEGLNHLNKRVALALTWGAGEGVPDVANTRYILNFGSNPFESHEFYVGLIGRLTEARMTRRAKLVTFDPRLSKTAGNSDEWFSIKPGTDGAVALAMARTIMELEHYDRGFLEQWTNTSVEKLGRHLSPYTPEAAEKISGVKAADIVRIAHEFADARPATILSGGGVVKHFNGVQNERCVILLGAMTGNIDIRGGYCLPRAYEFEEIAWGAGGGDADEPPLLPAIPAHQAIPRIKEGRTGCGIYFCHKSNPVYSNPNKTLIEEVLKNEDLVPYLVVMDTHLTETADLADLVLPAATYLESWGLESPPALDMIPFVALRQPIVKPMGKSRPVDDVLRELATRIGEGMNQYFPFGSVEDYIGHMISRIDGLVEVGGLDYLKEHGVWFNADDVARFKAYEESGFNTPTGMLEVDSEWLRGEGLPSLPVYETIPGHDTLTGEFILTIFNPGLLTERTGNCKWLSEIVHDNPIWINKVTAAELHIERGDLVKVTSKLGSFVARAHLTQGIHPSVIAVADGLGHWKYGSFARAKRSKSRDPDTRLLWWGENWLRVNPNTAIPEWSDPIGGGQAWMDTRVSIMRI